MLNTSEWQTLNKKKLLRKVDNQLPSDKASHLRSMETECSLSHHPGWNWELLEARMVQKDAQHRLLKEHLEGNVRIW